MLAEERERGELKPTNANRHETIVIDDVHKEHLLDISILEEKMGKEVSWSQG